MRTLQLALLALATMVSTHTPAQDFSTVEI